MITSYDVNRAETIDECNVLAREVVRDFDGNIDDAENPLQAASIFAATTENVHLLRICSELIARREALKL